MAEKALRALAHRLAVDNEAGELSVLLDKHPWLIHAKGKLRRHPLIGRCGLLDSACVHGAVDCARLLLDRGAPVDASHETGRTPLTLACFSGFPEVVALLLSRGAETRRALLYTVVGPRCWRRRVERMPEHIAVLRLLLKDGRVVVNENEPNNPTALWWACFLGFTDLARVLLVEGGADHTITDTGPEGRTAMEEARLKGRQECVELLQVSG